MHAGSRRILDRSFTGIGLSATALLTLSVLVLLLPIVVGGCRAFVFRGTVEFRRMLLQLGDTGDFTAVQQEIGLARDARQPLYAMLADFEKELREQGTAKYGFRRRRELQDQLKQVHAGLQTLFGPAPGEPTPVLLRNRYGQTRWDRAQVKLDQLLYVETYDYSDPTRMGVKKFAPRAAQFAGTPLEKFFPYLQHNLEAMLRPQWTCYWRFLFDPAYDNQHFFGGVWSEMLGTIWLTLGAMLFSVPLGVLSAVYLVEFTRGGALVSLLRTFINTLAGVPSIVFGLFGLAFFLNTLHIPKSVLAGALTLGLLVLPVVIRAAEEALRGVPATYKEAALSLGASKWRTVVTVILPAALPGILTGTVISMGRAAGETAPIIFTAAISYSGVRAVSLWDTLLQPTRALSWNIYNLATENQAVDEIRHVQYGMVLVLVLVVLLLNAAAIVLRARIAKNLRG